MMRPAIFIFIWLFLTPSAFAEETFGKGPAIPTRPHAVKKAAEASLTTEQVERIKAFKQLTRDVDGKSTQEAIDEIAAADNPSIELAIREAIARTYADVARDEKVVDPKQKEWLFGMVTINMAYLQFGAQNDDSGNALNRIIRRKLREYLPSEVVNQPGFLHKLQGLAGPR